ncbi:hypothetical protein AWB69_00019 [Caballeronia udeis]|uniref:DUF5681 domain-containing protein n=1 Tax=Caballeronia udeis TaxID=1232866 RepID=A0A158EQE3_9BURK|nr:DUF5681 domain-containing protein [Caballeronia udeis]SAL09309.1 hypothetical protein AWB69_00019 [Caballeronia udeis]
MTFKKGQSGNPKGRPRTGSDKRTDRRADTRALFLEKAPDLVKKVLELALAGDTTMLRLCVDRIVPSLRPTDGPISISLPAGSLVDQGQAVLDALAVGKLTTDQANSVMGVIQGQAKIFETDELARRVAALEAGNGGST